MMTLFNKTNYWKIILMILGAGILVTTILYSNFLATKLKENEEKNVSIYIKAIDEINKPDTLCDVTFATEVQISFPLPVIVEDETGLLVGINFSEDDNNDQKFLNKRRDEFLKSGREPLVGTGGYAKYIYYFNSQLLDYIRLFPFVQGLLVSLYIALGYILFSSSRRAEQNRVWAGMAKETAHQLGTPISAIIGWIEYLRDHFKDDPGQLDVVNELNKDVERLELVADRFSKIGSEPVLQETNIYDELVEVKEYLQRRSPRKVVFEFFRPESDIFAMVNKHLFAWVIENLVRNSLDAMDGKGRIWCQIYKQNNYVYIELSDTGHGIPSGKFKSIFNPGYSTKKRGWGLGLSLAKRIVEEYHKGKIFVKSSKPNEETTFCIVLPLTVAFHQPKT